MKLRAAAVLALVSQALVAQQPQPTFRTEANYVRVDVFPTKDGGPVLDLAQNDFEILEGGVPQKIEQFEHLVVRAAGPQETRIEPNTVAESRSMAASPRARLFVLFLDTYHVDVADSHNIRKPLIDALDRAIGADDLVAVMTPEMSATDIVFARKTITIEGMLTRYWHWGERNRQTPVEAEDQDYGTCYPNVAPGSQPDCTDQNGIAAEMIDRRHEKRAIDALEDLVRYLAGVREERKAVLAITNGWLLYRPDSRLERPLRCHPLPTGPAIGVDPGGRLTTKEPPRTGFNYQTEQRCNTDRMRLAQIDDQLEFRQLLDEANRANASFYPVDPRGLAVFDTPIMRTDVPGPPPPMVPLAVDSAMLRSRLESLRTLAAATDGLAMVDSNDIARSLNRAVADLSSYYLLGYYSTGRLDGRFHAITVRVKRPGVDVRARRGYLAATARAVSAAARTAAAPASDAETLAIRQALTPLAETIRDVPLRVRAFAGWRPGPGGTPTAAFWVVGEFGGTAPIDRDVDVSILDAAGTTIARGTAPGGARSALVTIAPVEPPAPGEYTVRVRSEGFGTGTVHVALPASPDASGALVVRRGPTTGNKEMPTADLRFRRSEQIRVDVPATSRGAVTARLLDRTGRPLAVPVSGELRQDPDGARWQSARLALAPLAPADYIIEVTADDTRMLVGFRVIP